MNLTSQQFSMLLLWLHFMGLLENIMQLPTKSTIYIYIYIYLKTTIAKREIDQAANNIII